MSGEIIPTRYWKDFTRYYDWAVELQGINVSSEDGRNPHESDDLHVPDPLMHYITIYDVVERKYAGFSNAIQQIWHGSDNPKRWQIDKRFDGIHETYTERDWLWLFLLHRVTGSGASFSYDHGFRNSILSDMAFSSGDAEDMRKYVLSEMRTGRPIFTSIGNQIPPFPKPSGEYKRGGELYIGEYMTRLVDATYQYLQDSGGGLSIAETVDWVNQWHKDNGLKQFIFVLTAWIMDIAEYMPHYVDQYSRVHYGSNAVEALELLFDGRGFKNKKMFLDAAMDYVVEHLHSPYAEDDKKRGIGKAYSLEDVCCDYVRYVGCYVPKGYEHLEPWQVTHNSLIDDYPKHHTWVKHVTRYDQPSLLK
jgi:hypothetical protein